MIGIKQQSFANVVIKLRLQKAMRPSTQRVVPGLWLVPNVKVCINKILKAQDPRNNFIFLTATGGTNKSHAGSDHQRIAKIDRENEVAPLPKISLSVGKAI